MSNTLLSPSEIATLRKIVSRLTAGDECPLSDSEIAVIQELANGVPPKVAAHNIGITRDALHGRVKTAANKTGARGITAIVALAIKKGWVE